MSRQTWMDSTIEAAREADIRLPWSRKPAPVKTPAQQPAAIRANV